MKQLLREIRRCTVCAEHLPAGPRPIVQAHPSARIAVVGQAPGRRVHASGIPWDDPSGKRLREWMGVDDDVFYDETRIALVPMGFCYPGTGTSGDLPPRPECAPLWHDALFEAMPNVELILLLSRYALSYYLKDAGGRTVTDVVRSWRAYTPRFIPLPHPSPRNNRWLKQNPWFSEDVVPEIRRRVESVL